MEIESNRKKLNYYKKISTQLKSKVMTQKSFDQSAINQILKTISHPNFIPIQHNENQNNDIYFTRTPSPNKNQYNRSSQNYSPQLPFSIHNNIGMSNTNYSSAHPIYLQQSRYSRNSSKISLTQQQSVPLEIEQYKLKISKLQQNLNKLKSQINDLTLIKQIKSEQQWKQILPYIDKQSNISVFVTKLFIKQYDFDKIDYQKSLIQLDKQKLIIYIPNKQKKQFNLSLLHEVIYIGNTIIRIEFKQQEIIFVYIQFDNIQQKKQWDLAIFTAHHIIKDKEIDKNIFVQNKYVEKILIKQSSKSSLKKQEFKSQKIRKGSIMFQNIRKTDKSSNSKQSVNQSQKKLQQSRSISRFNNDHLQYTLNGQAEGTTSEADTIDKDIKDFMVFTDFNNNNQKQSRANTSKFNEKDIIFQDIQKEQQIQVHSTRKQIEKQQQQKRKKQDIINRLKQGFYFTKYAKGAYKPHDKKIYLSNDQKTLICQSKQNPNNKKIIPLPNILKIFHPMVGQGVKRHIPQPIQQNYCLIEYQSQGTIKYLQIGSLKNTLILKFYNQLKYYLQNNGFIQQQ